MPILDFDNNLCDAKNDLLVFDSENLWSVLYERLKNQSALVNKDATSNAAREVDNRWKNRYRDITPYDSTRVFLDSGFLGDYINASYVEVPCMPSRRYILTQGPMQQTMPHFWQMIWERQSPAIVMLNRIFEKGTMRCHPYFPLKGGAMNISFGDTELCVRMKQENNQPHYVQRNFELINTKTNEQRHLIHFHYTSWPDFGVPCSPSAMLNFLWAVRGSGALNDPDHPAVIHCSAGVGRSGAFVLIDLALCLVEARGTLKGINLAELFVDLRRCRMGIIQTSDQLRFCYSAVVLGAKEILAVPPDQIPFIHFQPDAANNDRFDLSSSDSDGDWESLDDIEFESSVGDNDDEIIQDVNREVHQHIEPRGNEDEFGTTTRLGHARETCHTYPVFRDNLPFKEFSPPQPTALLHDSEMDNDEVDEVKPVTKRFTASAGVSDGCRVTRTNGIPRISSESNRQAVDGGTAVTADDRSTTIVGHPVNRVHLRSIVQDRSNNAVTIASLDEADQPVTNNANSNESAFPMETVDIAPTVAVYTANGDHAYTDQGDGNIIAPSIMPLANASSNVRSLDPLTSAYLEASLDLRDRRDARRLRLARMQERVEDIRQRMRAADLERKRWIPAWAMPYMRRFFAESGYVRSPAGVAISTTLFFLVTIGVTTLFYSYWFSI